MNKYSFWIIPENELYREIETVVAKYSAEYNVPSFVPHLTLHGPILSTEDIAISSAQRAASKIKPFAIEVGSVEFSTTYFQCVLVRMKTSAQLLGAHLILKSELGVTEDHVFMPHASLVYGDFDMSTRQKIAAEVTFKTTSFMAKQITIVHADSRDPQDWGIVKQISLGV